jgi:hypothetical protein
MLRVLELCQNATVSEEADGNVVIVTNMRLEENGILSSFDEEFDLIVED